MITTKIKAKLFCSNVLVSGKKKNERERDRERKMILIEL